MPQLEVVSGSYFFFQSQNGAKLNHHRDCSNPCSVSEAGLVTGSTNRQTGQSLGWLQFANHDTSVSALSH